MCEDVRGSADRQTQGRNKARLALCLFSMVVISLVGGVSLGAQTNQFAKNGDAYAQGAVASRNLSPSQDPKAEWWAINKEVAEQLSANDLGEFIKSLPQAATNGDVVE